MGNAKIQRVIYELKIIIKKPYIANESWKITSSTELKTWSYTSKEFSTFLDIHFLSRKFTWNRTTWSSSCSFGSLNSKTKYWKEKNEWCKKMEREHIFSNLRQVQEMNSSNYHVHTSQVVTIFLAYMCLIILNIEDNRGASTWYILWRTFKNLNGDDAKTFMLVSLDIHCQKWFQIIFVGS